MEFMFNDSRTMVAVLSFDDTGLLPKTSWIRCNKKVIEFFCKLKEEFPEYPVPRTYETLDTAYKTFYERFYSIETQYKIRDFIKQLNITNDLIWWKKDEDLIIDTGIFDTGSQIVEYGYIPETILGVCIDWVPINSYWRITYENRTDEWGEWDGSYEVIEFFPEVDDSWQKIYITDEGGLTCGGSEFERV